MKENLYLEHFKIGRYVYSNRIQQFLGYFFRKGIL